MSLPSRPAGDNTPAYAGRAPDALTSPAPTNASVALAYAQRGWPVFPICWPTAEGSCGCGGGHEGHDIGKAPVGRLAPHGVKDAQTNTATVDRWWRATPSANVGIALEPARLVLVDPDSAETEMAALSRGLDGGAVRESRYRAYLFTRPADCPSINLIKVDGDPLDVMATGYVVAWGTHAIGCPVRLDPAAVLSSAPDWAVHLLKARSAERTAHESVVAARSVERSTHVGAAPPVRLRERGQRRWDGRLVAETKDGRMDRDLSLFYLGLDLAECNASEEAIVDALRERDEALGWRKFTGRSDAEKRYTEIAVKAVARAIELDNTQQAAPSAPATGAGLGELRVIIEDQAATIMRLQRAHLDKDDRLEILEDIVHSIDDVLNRPNEEMSAGEKVAMIVIARWLPYYRSKKEAQGERPRVSLGYVAKVAGSSKSTIGNVFSRFSSDNEEDGAPFKKLKHRRALFDDDGRPVLDDHGSQIYVTELEIVPWADRPSDILRASVRYAGAHLKPKHGGSQHAADVRWGRCDKHDNDVVRVKGYCPDCGQVLGERTIRVEEFEALNRQDEQVGQTARTGVHGDDRYLTGKQVAHSEPPVSLFDYAASRPQERPKRCPAPGCTALEFRPHPDGSWRCLKSGHDPSVYRQLIPSIAGGSE